ncbi:hypothetical protein CVT25_002093, partial [Psilocybe cyanescens]
MCANRQNPAKESKVKALGNRLKKSLGLGSPSTGTVPRKEAAKLRAKYTRFRILVIGRANAGKTTLLKRVCNTTEEPSIYNEDENLVSYPALRKISDNLLFRGTHDVRRAFTFKSNPKFIFHDSAGFEAGGEEELKAFIFHDSAGFEAGGEEELKAVMDFIEEGSKAHEVDDQIHII